MLSLSLLKALFKKKKREKTFKSQYFFMEMNTALSLPLEQATYSFLGVHLAVIQRRAGAGLHLLAAPCYSPQLQGGLGRAPGGLGKSGCQQGGAPTPVWCHAMGRGSALAASIYQPLTAGPRCFIGACTACGSGRRGFQDGQN